MSSLPSDVSIRIRPMRMEDVKQVHNIDVESFSMPWPESAYRYELKENPRSLLWVAETQDPEGQDEIVGLIVVWLILDEAHIATIAVHPDFRNRRIGKRLLATALQESIRYGAREATLEVRAHNEIAQRLYQRFGFEIVGRRSRYYRDNQEDALIMTRSPLDRQYIQWLESDAWQDGNYPVQLAPPPGQA